MAINKANRPNEDGTFNFFADAAADIANLPTNIPIGSTCLVTGTSAVYILSPSCEWKEL